MAAASSTLWNNDEFEGRTGIREPDSNIYITSKDPMLNSLILQNTLGYLKLEDIKTCRQVCRLWKTVARPFVQTLSVVTFGSNEEKLHDFVTQMKNSEYLPSTRFAFRSQLSTEIIRFCKRFAGDVTFLDLFTMCDSYSNLVVKDTSIMEQLRKLFSTTSFLNLQELILLSYIPNPASLSSPPILTKILSTASFTNLKKLSVVQLSDGNMLALLKALPNLESIQVWNLNWDFVLNSLKEIDSTSRNKIRRIISTTAKFNLARLEKLVALNLTLTHLAVSHETEEIHCDDVAMFIILIEQFLNQQKTSLKMLSIPQILSGKDSNIRYINFPCMESLTELHVGCQFVCCIDTYETHFPVLTRFSCTFNLDNILSIRTLDSTPCFSVTHLVDLPATNHTLVHFAHLREQFPNVINLELCVRINCIAESLWSLWPKLKVLKLQFGFEFADTVFTGLSVEDSCRIRINRSYDSVNLNDFNVFPSIRNLTNLTSLTLIKLNTCQNKHYRYELAIAPMSDIIAYLGISTLKQLRELVLTGFSFSPQCVQDMIRRLPNLLPLQTRIES